MTAQKSVLTKSLLVIMLFFLHNVTSLRTEPKDDRVGIFGKTVPKDVAPGKENVAAVRVLGAAGPL